MAASRDFDIIGPFNRSDADKFESEKLVNLYVDIDARGKKGKALFPTPGLDLDEGIKFAGTKKGRALYILENHMYAVIGSVIWRISTNLSATQIGSINTEIGHVGIADNGKEILFVDGTAGWIWNDDASTFTQIVAAGFPLQPTDAAILGARFIVSNVNSPTVAFSEINDGTSWNALDEFSITSQPDNVIGIRRLNDRLFIMGNRVTEVWYDAGEAYLPFRRANVLPFGCDAVGSIAEAFGFLMWLSKSDGGLGSVVMSSGTDAKSVSIQAIENEFQTYNITSDATAFIHRDERGHIFYQINFTNADRSWAYDISENNWSQLEYNSKNRHLAEDHAFFANKHLVVDYNAPYIYEMSKKYFTDNGVSIRRLRITPPLSDPTYRKIFLHSIMFDLIQGEGNDGAGINSDPTLKLRISRDGGISYGNELSAKIGKVGQRELRTQFFRLGESRSFIFEIKYDNSTAFVLLGASINIDVEGGGF